MNILVAGGAGFLGSRLAKLLVKAGHQVHVLDNLSTGDQQRLPVGVDFTLGDVQDEGVLEKVFQHPFSAVYYCVKDLQATPVALLAQCQKQVVGKFVYFSSAAVYGEVPEKSVREDSLLAPASVWGMIHARDEKAVQESGVPAIILRCATVYGEGSRENVISRFSWNIAHCQPLEIYGTGDQSRDFVYVEDVARAALAALPEGVELGIYNISTKIETTINAIKEILIYFSHLSVPVNYQDDRAGDIYRSVLDNQKAKEKLNWQPKTKLMPGLMKTYQSFLEEGEEK